VSEIGGVGKKQLFERALRQLRARILSGELKPDTHISETAAAEEMGVSRTPMREAMAQLVEEGLLERRQSGRCTVRPLTRDDIVDHIELRGVLEGTVVRLAAERGADPDAMARCAGILDRIDLALGASAEEIAFDRYADLNEAFHDALSRISGSPTMTRELSRVNRLPLASPNAFLHRQADVAFVRNSLFRAQAQHRALLTAIRQRQGTRAEALAREHARLAQDNLDYAIFDHRGLVEHIPGLAMVAAEAAPGAAPTRSHQGRIE